MRGKKMEQAEVFEFVRERDEAILSLWFHY